MTTHWHPGRCCDWNCPETPHTRPYDVPSGWICVDGHIRAVYGEPTLEYDDAYPPHRDYHNPASVWLAFRGENGSVERAKVAAITAFGRY